MLFAIDIWLKKLYAQAYFLDLVTAASSISFNEQKLPD